MVAVDEAVLKVNGQICYLWAAVEVDTNEVLAEYASRGGDSKRSSSGRYWIHVKVSHS
jgi:transposase-like protein